jgi:hypothetical protein
MGIWFWDRGSREAWRLRPPNWSRKEPPEAIVERRISMGRPRTNPVKAWRTIAPMSPALSWGIPEGAMWGTASIASPPPIPILATTGTTARLEKGGTTESQASARTVARSQASSQRGSTEMVTGASAVEE